MARMEARRDQAAEPIAGTFRFHRVAWKPLALIRGRVSLNLLPVGRRWSGRLVRLLVARALHSGHSRTRAYQHSCARGEEISATVPPWAPEPARPRGQA